MAEQEALNLLMHPFLTNVILPFLLVFVVIFAILEKTKLLGEGKRNANLLVALVIGILFISVQKVVGFTITIIPVVAVLIMILLCFYLVFGFIGIHEIKGLQIALGIIFGGAFIVIILWASGLLSKITGGMTSNIISIVTLVAVIGGAIALVFTQRPKQS